MCEYSNLENTIGIGNPSDTSGDMMIFNRMIPNKKKRLSLKDYLKNSSKKLNRDGKQKRKNKL